MVIQQNPLVLSGVIFALLSVPLLAGTESTRVETESVRSVRQGSGSLPSVGMPPCPEPLPYRLVGSRELSELTKKVSESITDVRASLEEWGTMSLSGLLLAPPVVSGTGTFAVDINGANSKYNFDYWFKESGKAEGTAQFTERIFNSLVAPG